MTIKERVKFSLFKPLRNMGWGGSWKLHIPYTPSFLTWTLDGDVCLTSRSGHSTPKEGAPIPTERGAVWALAPVRFLEKRKSLAPTETRTPDRRIYVYACQQNYSVQRNEVVINHDVTFYKQSPSQKPHRFTSEHFRNLSTAPISYLVTFVTLELLETTKFQSWMSRTSLWA